jgi:hypothetical protein
MRLLDLRDRPHGGPIEVRHGERLVAYAVPAGAKGGQWAVYTRASKSADAWKLPKIVVDDVTALAALGRFVKNPRRWSEPVQ